MARPKKPPPKPVKIREPTPAEKAKRIRMDFEDTSELYPKDKREQLDFKRHLREGKHPRLAAYEAVADRHTKTKAHFLESTYNWAKEKLIKLAEEYIPADDAVDENGYPKQIDLRIAHHAVSVIAEINKMEGNHSAEKYVHANVNMDADVLQTKILIGELLLKHEKEF